MEERGHMIHKLNKITCRAKNFQDRQMVIDGVL